MTRPQILIEVSWETANMVGGIHTVLATKAAAMRAYYPEHSIAIGPDLWKDSPEPPSIRREEIFPGLGERARKRGLAVRQGRWTIPGEPACLLVDFSGLYAAKDEILARLWTDFGVDSLLAVELVRKLESAVGRPLPPTLLFERRCISDVAAHLGGAAVAQSAQQATPAPLPPPPADERVTLPPPREVAEGGHAAVLATPGALRLVRLASEPPAPGEVEIAVEAAGVNFIDVLATAGMHPRIASAAFVPGHEVAGTISRVGAGVALAPGMRVMALVRAGGYAERVVTPAESVTPLPDGVSAEDAAAVLLVGLTAIACLEEHAHLRAGETVLVQAAAGATGTACVQLAKHLGARVIGTAGGPEKLAHLARLGVDHPVDYRTTDFADAVRALTCGRGVDVIVDSLSGDAIGKGLGVLAPGGRFVEIGAAGVVPVPPVDPRVLFARDQAFIGCNVGRLDESPARLARLAARLLEHLASGALRPAIGGRYSLSDAADAHALLRARGNLGKLVLRP